MKALNTAAAPAAIGPYSQAVDSGAGLVFVSGQLPIDPATGAFPQGGVKEQTRQSLLNAVGEALSSHAAFSRLIVLVKRYGISIGCPRCLVAPVAGASGSDGHSCGCSVKTCSGPACKLVTFACRVVKRYSIALDIIGCRVLNRQRTAN